MEYAQHATQAEQHYHVLLIITVSCSYVCVCVCAYFLICNKPLVNFAYQTLQKS